MPGYKVHMAIGVILVALFLLVNLKFHFMDICLKDLLLYLPLILVFSTLPDIDHRESIPRLIVTVGILIAIIYFALISNTKYVLITSIMLLVVWILPFFPGFGHRGHMHSIAFVAVSSLLFVMVDYKLSILLFIAGLSHLIADGEVKLL